MVANIETMFFTNWNERSLPWHGLGTPLVAPPTSKEAIVAGGLDWQVVKRPLFTVDGNGQQVLIKERFANVRDTDNQVLGVIGDDYKIVQNSEAFEFTDALLGEGVKYETAGSLAMGKRVWLLAKMPETKIFDDVVEPYLVFMNAHDGRGAIRVALTPVRVVCQNTLNVAIKGAKRIWSTKHMGDMKSKLTAARNTLEFSKTYMENLKLEAETMRAKVISDAQVIQICDALMMPKGDDISERAVKNAKEKIEELKYRYHEAPDLAEFRGTAWGFINAVSDFVTHTDHVRKTKTRKESLMMGAVEGYDLINEAHDILVAA